MFSFVHHRRRFYAVALVLVGFSLLSPWILPRGINLGIDMTGGIQIEYAVEKGNAENAETLAREKAMALIETIQVGGKSIVNGVNVYGIAGTDSFIVEAGFLHPEGSSDAEIESAKANFTKSLTESLASDTTATISESRYVNV